MGAHLPKEFEADLPAPLDRQPNVQWGQMRAYSLRLDKSFTAICRMATKKEYEGSTCITFQIYGITVGRYSDIQMSKPKCSCRAEM